MRDEDDAECLWIRETGKAERGKKKPDRRGERGEGKGDQQRIISSHQRTNISRKMKENEEAQALKALREEGDATKHRFNKSQDWPTNHRPSLSDGSGKDVTRCASIGRLVLKSFLGPRFPEQIAGYYMTIDY